MAQKIDDYVMLVKEKFFPDVEIYGADAEAPNSYDELRMWKGSPCLPVFTGGCDKTIFDTPETNYMMRGIHDLTHLKYGLSFKPEDEVECARHHVQQFKKVGAPDLFQRMIYEDTHAQVRYYAETGKFVDNQRAFVNAVLNHGLEAVLKTGREW
jgi:hypothetical protein